MFSSEMRILLNESNALLNIVDRIYISNIILQLNFIHETSNGSDRNNWLFDLFIEFLRCVHARSILHGVSYRKAIKF